MTTTSLAKKKEYLHKMVTKRRTAVEPLSKNVVKLVRSSDATGAFVDPNLRKKGVDFDPPSRIADLKAKKVGETNEGLVKLSWTATGDDWNYGK